MAQDCLTLQSTAIPSRVLLYTQLQRVRPARAAAAGTKGTFKCAAASWADSWAGIWVAPRSRMLVHLLLVPCLPFDDRWAQGCPTALSRVAPKGRGLQRSCRRGLLNLQAHVKPLSKRRAPRQLHAALPRRPQCRRRHPPERQHGNAPGAAAGGALRAHLQPAIFTGLL